jgi:hypothetical protein
MNTPQTVHTINRFLERPVLAGFLVPGVVRSVKPAVLFNQTQKSRVLVSRPGIQSLGAWHLQYQTLDVISRLGDRQNVEDGISFDDKSTPRAPLIINILFFLHGGLHPNFTSIPHRSVCEHSVRSSKFRRFQNKEEMIAGTVFLLLVPDHPSHVSETYPMWPALLSQTISFRRISLGFLGATLHCKIKFTIISFMRLTYDRS